MPKQSDPEIIAFHKAIKDGILEVTPTTTEQECLQKVHPCLKYRCDTDTSYKAGFSTYLCRYKRKVFQNRALQPLDDAPVPQEPDPPAPTTTRTDTATNVPDVPAAKRPPKRKPPKKRVPIQAMPSPQPSPAGSTDSAVLVSYPSPVTYCFSDSFWERQETPARATKHKETSPAPSPAKPPPSKKKPLADAAAKPAATKPAAKTTTMPSSNTNSDNNPMRPEDWARKINDGLAPFPATVDLRDPDSSKYNIEMYKWAWPAVDGTMHVCYCCYRTYRCFSTNLLTPVVCPTDVVCYQECRQCRSPTWRHEY